MHLLEKDRNEKLRPGHEAELRRFIFESFQQAKTRNASYSLRAFARKLKMAPSALSEILRGKRAISKANAEKILTELYVAPIEREKLLEPFLNCRKNSGVHPRSQTAIQLEMDQYRAIADWYHFAILSLAETQGFKSDSEWIATRLRLSVKVVDEAIERLTRLELLRRDELGTLFPTGISYSTPDGIAERSLRRGHDNNLEHARLSLERDSVADRDFTAMTMAIDPSKLPEAKKRIRRFQNELCAFLESDRKSEVYKICLQLFPLTNLSGE